MTIITCIVPAYLARKTGQTIYIQMILSLPMIAGASPLPVFVSLRSLTQFCSSCRLGRPHENRSQRWQQSGFAHRSDPLLLFCPLLSLTLAPFCIDSLLRYPLSERYRRPHLRSPHSKQSVSPPLLFCTRRADEHSPCPLSVGGRTKQNVAIVIVFIVSPRPFPSYSLYADNFSITYHRALDSGIASAPRFSEARMLRVTTLVRPIGSSLRSFRPFDQLCCPPGFIVYLACSVAQMVVCYTLRTIR